MPDDQNPTPDPTPDPAPPADPKPDPEPAPKPDPTPKPTETVEFWKGKAREQERRAKDNADAATQLGDIRSQLTAALERAEIAEGKIAEHDAAKQIDDWKAAVSAETGVPAGLLRGASEDELKAHAEELKAFLPDPSRLGFIPAEGRSPGTPSTDPGAQFGQIISGLRTHQ